MSFLIAGVRVKKLEIWTFTLVIQSLSEYISQTQTMQVFHKMQKLILNLSHDLRQKPAAKLQDFLKIYLFFSFRRNKERRRWRLTTKQPFPLLWWPLVSGSCTLEWETSSSPTCTRNALTQSHITLRWRTAHLWRNIRGEGPSFLLSYLV